MLKVSVVVSTCNRYQSISRTLESLLESTVQPLEILVVDQSDEQHRIKTTIEALQSDLIRCIFLDQKGASIGRNAGMRQCKGEIVAFTDDDAVVRKDWIEKTLQTFEDKRFRTGVAGGVIIPVYEEYNPGWEIPYIWEHILPAYTQIGSIAPYREGLPPGVNYAIRRELIDTVGYFDESLGPQWGRENQLFGEDSNYSLRARAAGYEIIFNPESIVYHPVPLSRQSEDFLFKRLYSKGLSEIAVQYSMKFPSKSKMLAQYATRLLRYSKLKLNYRQDEIIRKGSIKILQGELAMIRAHILDSYPLKSSPE